MAEIPLDNHPTLIASELDNAIIAVQSGTPKVWRKVSPAQLIAFLGISATPAAPPFKGLHLATAQIPAGDTTVRARQSWTLEPNIPAGIVLTEAFGVTNGFVNLPHLPFTDTQRGWYMELLKDDVVISASTQPFGQPFPGFLGAGLYGTNNAGDAIQFYWGVSDQVQPAGYIVTSSTVFNIAADDDIKAHLYVAN